MSLEELSWIATILTFVGGIIAFVIRTFRKKNSKVEQPASATTTKQTTEGDNSIQIIGNNNNVNKK